MLPSPEHLVPSCDGGVVAAKDTDSCNQGRGSEQMTAALSYDYSEAEKYISGQYEERYDSMIIYGLQSLHLFFHPAQFKSHHISILYHIVIMGN